MLVVICALSAFICLIRFDYSALACIFVIVANYAASLCAQHLTPSNFIMFLFLLDLISGVMVLKLSGQKMWGVWVAVIFSFMIAANIVNANFILLWALNVLATVIIVLSSLYKEEFNGAFIYKHSFWNKLFSNIAKFMHKRIWKTQKIVRKGQA